MTNTTKTLICECGNEYKRAGMMARHLQATGHHRADEATTAEIDAHNAKMDEFLTIPDEDEDSEADALDDRRDDERREEAIADQEVAPAKDSLRTDGLHFAYTIREEAEIVVGEEVPDTIFTSAKVYRHISNASEAAAHWASKLDMFHGTVYIRNARTDVAVAVVTAETIARYVK